MAIAMASTRPLFLHLFFAAVLVLSATNPSTAQRPKDIVLDNDGDRVRIGSSYAIRAEGFGFFGGVTALPPANKTACAIVVGLGEETDPGTPIRLTPGFPDEASSGVLGIRIRSQIQFDKQTIQICGEPTLWTTQADTSDADGGLFTAIVAGRELFTNATSAWFEVRPTNKARVYKLVYCPCLACRILCTDEIGRHVVGNRVALGIGGSSFTFRFIKSQPLKATDNLPLAAV